MVLSNDEYATRAAFYDKAADDDSAPRELRMVFARKANWLHIVARLEAQAESGQIRYDDAARESTRVEGEEALLFSPRRLAGVR
jgi:hypothetical protein